MDEFETFLFVGILAAFVATSVLLYLATADEDETTKGR